MTTLVSFELPDGGQVLVEVDDDEPGVVPAARPGVAVQSAAANLEAALGGIRDAAATALRALRDMAEAPDELEIRFGVRLNASAGAFIAKTGAEGHLEVSARWAGASIRSAAHTAATPETSGL